MAGSVNKVILVGNLGKDPEIRRTQDGRPIANLRIATSDTWRDKATGERREKTEWHSVVIFNENLCKIAEQYLKKGSKVFIEGSLQTRKWQGQDGQDRYSTEVVLQGFNGNLTMLDGRAAAGAGAGMQEGGQADYGGGSETSYSDAPRGGLARSILVIGEGDELVVLLRAALEGQEIVVAAAASAGKRAAYGGPRLVDGAAPLLGVEEAADAAVNRVLFTPHGIFPPMRDLGKFRPGDLVRPARNASRAAPRHACRAGSGGRNSNSRGTCGNCIGGCSRVQLVVERKALSAL